MKFWIILSLSLFFAPHLNAAEVKTPAPTATTQGVNANDAYHFLVAGNKRFVENKMEHPVQNSTARESLVQGQKPHTIVLSCSDSRVPPELIFDQGLGQIFVVRTAGEVIGPHAIGSIEYALEHLGARLIVVMGHESCGAVKAALTTKPGTSSGSSNIDSLISSIQPNIKSFLSGSQTDTLLTKPVKAQVSGVTRQLMRQSKVARELAEAGELVVANAIYSLGSGKVDFWSVGTPIIIENEHKPVLSSVPEEKSPSKLAAKKAKKEKRDMPPLESVLKE